MQRAPGARRERWARALPAAVFAGVLLVSAGGAAAAAGSGTTAPGRLPASGPPASAAAARREAAAWLALLPAYPDAAPVTPRPYLVLRVSPLGFPLPERAPGVPVAPAAGVPGSPYLVDLYRAWRAPASMASIEAWVNRTAAALHLQSTGSSSGSGPRPTDQTAGLAFGMAGGSLAPGLQVSLRYIDAHDSWVRYDAMVIWTPPRPAGEYVPPDAVAVMIAVVQGIPPQVAAAHTVTDRSTILRLTRLVNGLSRDTRGAHSCPADVGNEATLTFVYGGGGVRHAVSVREGSCDDVTFGPPGRYPALTDPGFRMWNAAVVLAGQPSRVQAGPI